MKAKKQLGVFLALAVILTCALPLASCGEAKTAAPKVVSDLALDFESGDFTFTGVEGNVKNYYLRIYPAGTQNPDEQMDALRAARRVRPKVDETKYEATVDLSDLQPGDRYDAYLYTYVKDSNGDLQYALSAPVTGVYKTTYSTPSGSGVSATIEGNTVTVKLTNNFFTSEYQDKDPSYQITLYEGATVKESKTLQHGDLDIVTTTSTNCCGQEETSSEIVGTVTFNVSNPAGNYSVTVKLLSMDATAYRDSAEGERVAVTEPGAEDPAQGGQTGGNAGGGSGS